MIKASNYNSCIDFAKGIACIFVVFMHCEFPGRFGIIVQAISRFSVPFFFMVSGFFCYYPDADGLTDFRYYRKLRHIGQIVLWSIFFYLIVALITSWINDNYSLSVTIRQVYNLLIFNAPFIIAGQLWFLFALLYDYLVFGLLWRIGRIKILYYFASIMIVLYFILAQGAYLAGYQIPNRIYRNWMVEGLAFFMMGHWIHAHEDSFNKVTNKVLLIVVSVSSALCLVERYLLGRDFGVNIATVPQVIALFLYAVNNPKRHVGLLQMIGKKYSMWVYILHPFVWHMVDRLIDNLSVNGNLLIAYLRPIIVVLFTLGLSYTCYRLFHRDRTIKKKLVYTY